MPVELDELDVGTVIAVYAGDVYEVEWTRDGETIGVLTMYTKGGEMAERLESFQFGSAGRPMKYPWAEWTDGSIWLIRQGEDFTSACVTMKQSLYHRALRHGFVVQVHQQDPTTIVFKFTKKEPNGEG